MKRSGDKKAKNTGVSSDRFYLKDEAVQFVYIEPDAEALLLL